MDTSTSSLAPAGAIVQPLSPRIEGFAPEAILPIRALASRFGYADAIYFRKHVAPRLGLAPLRRNNRYFVLGAEANAAVRRFVEGGLS